jgi:hypothetical protein
MRPWEAIVPAEDRDLYARTGLGARRELGRRPALLVVDVVDSLIVCGTSTSGCVRATVTDAQSYGYTVFVVEECRFDRSELLRLVNLFDMNAKYADVITLDEIRAMLQERGAASARAEVAAR